MLFDKSPVLKVKVPDVKMTCKGFGSGGDVEGSGEAEGSGGFEGSAIVLEGSSFRRMISNLVGSAAAFSRVQGCHEYTTYSDSK